MTNLRIALSRTPEELRVAFANLHSARDVADILEVPYGQLMYITSQRADKYGYSTFTIPKRSGEDRTISAPHPTLKILQSKMNHILKLVYEPRASTHGFAEGRSVRTNAERHTKRRYVLNIDLVDFFPSIHFGRIRGVLMSKPYGVGAPAATVLARICSQETPDGRKLPQGAPTSPILSNMVCRRMDRELSALARESHCTYSRYADDITFSTNAREFPQNVAAYGPSGGTNDVVLGDDLRRIINENDFTINESKVRIQKRGQHQEVTGLTVNQFPNVRRNFIRQIRAMLHDWSVNGYDAAQDRYRREFDRARGPGRSNTSFRDVVYGKISFVKMVRGKDDLVYRKLRARILTLEGRGSSLMDDQQSSSPDRRYDVALSFAGPQRHIAEQIARRVSEAGFAVFYDRFERGRLWGTELAVTLESVYRDQARHCVILVSRDYVERSWTNVERQHAIARAIADRGTEYILPVVVEPADVPGFRIRSRGFQSMKMDWTLSWRS